MLSLGTRNDVIVQKDFVSDLEKAVAKANRVRIGKIASQLVSFKNPWLIRSKYIDAVDAKCVNSMLSKWETRLGGAREFMWTQKNKN